MGQAKKPGSGDLPFIISVDSTKPGDEARKLIRSHVMRGKNKGKSFRSRVSDQRSSTGREYRENVKASEVPLSPQDCLARHACIPNRVGTDISLGFEPIDTVDVSLLIPVLKFSDRAKQAMFSLEPHILFDEATHTRYRDYFGLDAAYLNAVVYTIHQFFDLAAGLNIESIQPSKPAYKHLVKSLSLIRERVACEDTQARLSDSTVTTIMVLASYSCISGQYETALSHLRGVRKIVDLRGGLVGFRSNTKLLIEIFRCDLNLALGSGAEPLFFYNTVTEPFMPYLNRLSAFIPPYFRAAYTPSSMASDGVGISDVELARAWDTSTTFCALLNYASESGRKIPQETLLNTMASVMYRLLRLSFPSGTREEMFRLSILSFCSHIFLQWPQVNFSHQHLSSMFKRCLVGLVVPVAPQALLWLLSVGFISLSFPEEDSYWLRAWLLEIFEVCGIDSWSEARIILKRHLWVDFLHDRLGLKMFETISQP